MLGQILYEFIELGYYGTKLTVKGIINSYYWLKGNNNNTENNSITKEEFNELKNEIKTLRETIERNNRVRIL
jgi:HAMP domain-containing protein